MLSFTQYPTFVVFLAVFLGAIVTMALMPVFIKFLRSHLIGQQVRADGPESHLVKQGTPTMGGIIMLIAATVVVAVLAEPVPETWLIMAAVLATGCIGPVRRRVKGCSRTFPWPYAESKAHRSIFYLDGVRACCG